MPRLTRNSMATPVSSVSTATSAPNVGLNTPLVPLVTPPVTAEQVSTTPTTNINQSQPMASGLPSQLAASSLGSSLGLHPTLMAQTTSGRPICEAPAFVQTFLPPSGSLVPELVFQGSSVLSASSTPLYSTSTTMHTGAPSSLGSGLSVLGLPSCTAPFVVGPGFIPIPPKLVQTIVGGHFVDLPILIQESCDEEPTTCTLLDGQLIINPGPRKTKLITDIVTWVQAFAIYASIYCTYQPQRARDLWLYQLFIIHMSKQFRGIAWANYDKAFRRDAAARNITDWSQMNVELFNVTR